MLMYSLPFYSAAIFLLLAMQAGELEVRPSGNSGFVSLSRLGKGIHIQILR